MTEGTSRLRTRAIVGSWFAALAAVLLALAVVGGAAAYTAHVDPGRTTERVDRTHWTADGSFAHSADVTRENPVFPVGSTLSNRSTYYAGPAPVLDARYVLGYSGAGADTATVDLDAALVTQSSGDGTVFWTDRLPLEAVDGQSLAPGESATAAFSLNASDVAQRRDSIRTALGDTQGEVSTFVAVDVTVAGTVDGRPANLSFTHRLPISVSGDTYTVGPAETGSESVTTTRTVTRPREYGPLWTLGGPLLGVVGLAGLGVLAVGRRRGAFTLSEAERDLLAFRDERAEFDEWVVRARLSTAFDDRARADAESLEDVVDFAIDAGTGVVEDPGTGLFYAVAPELVVVYEPPALAREELRAGTDEGVSGLLADSPGVSLSEDGDAAADEVGDDGDGDERAGDGADVDGPDDDAGADESEGADGADGNPVAPADPPEGSTPEE